MQELTPGFISSFLFLLLVIWIILGPSPEEIGAFMTKHRKLVRAVAIIVGVAIYLNIGWAIGTYYHTYIFGHEPQTFWQVVWKGGFHSIDGGEQLLLANQILLMFFWPLLVGVLMPITWVIYAIYHLAMLVWHAIVYVLWLAGAGGIAKLLGVG